MVTWSRDLRYGNFFGRHLVQVNQLGRQENRYRYTRLIRPRKTLVYDHSQYKVAAETSTLSSARSSFAFLLEGATMAYVIDGKDCMVCFIPAHIG